MPFLTAATTLYEQRKREQEAERARQAQIAERIRQEGITREENIRQEAATQRRFEQGQNPPITAYQRETMQQDQLRNMRTDLAKTDTAFTEQVQTNQASNARRNILTSPPYNYPEGQLPQYIDQNTMNQIVGTWGQQNPVYKPTEPKEPYFANQQTSTDIDRRVAAQFMQYVPDQNVLQDNNGNIVLERVYSNLPNDQLRSQYDQVKKQLTIATGAQGTIGAYNPIMQESQPITSGNISAPQSQRMAPGLNELTTQYPPSQYKGQTVTDTDTGQKYISDGIQWKPL